jgi:hypothetical protein
MIRGAGFILLVLASFLYRAQDPGYIDLVKKEDELCSLFNVLYSDTLSSPDRVLELIQAVMPRVLAEEGAMDFSWSRLDRIGVVTSDDGKLRIFTWHVMEDPDHYRYYGYIQMNQKKDRIRVFELTDNLKPQRNLTNLEQSTEDWYGKLYYNIITGTYKRKTYYTVLGMDFNNTNSTIKTIETLTLQRNKPQFEKGLYLVGESPQDRMVLEYSSQVSMTVRYDAAIRMIVFDHLEPLHQIYKNNYEFYGPNGSFDGLEFTDGMWIFRKDIDARNRD